MKPDPPGTALDTSTEAARSDVCLLDVLGQMQGRRRFWRVDQKLAILAEADHSDIATVRWQLVLPRQRQHSNWRHDRNPGSA